MNYSAQTFTHRMPRFMAQRPSSRKVVNISGGKQLWVAVARFALGLFLMLAFVQLLSGFYFQGVQGKIVAKERYQKELADQHIRLRAQRAALLMPQHIEKMAGTMLSLYVPEKSQVYRYNKKKRRFETL